MGLEITAPICTRPNPSKPVCTPLNLLNGTIDSLHHNTSNLVRVGIRSWSSILEVTVTLVATFSGDTDGATTVGNTISERVDATSLMSASKTQSVVLSVNCDVLHATRFAHLLTGEVAVKTSSVPVTWNWLGVEGDLGTKLLSDTVEEETGEPELITKLDTLTRTNLELPLGWHNLGVGTRDLDTSEQASLVVSLNNISAVDLASSDTTVVWSLWAGETSLWPAIWSV